MAITSRRRGRDISAIYAVIRRKKRDGTRDGRALVSIQKRLCLGDVKCVGRGNVECIAARVEPRVFRRRERRLHGTWALNPSTPPCSASDRRWSTITCFKDRKKGTSPSLIARAAAADRDAAQKSSANFRQISRRKCSGFLVLHPALASSFPRRRAPAPVLRQAIFQSAR